MANKGNWTQGKRTFIRDINNTDTAAVLHYNLSRVYE
jgi:hypothetical protein